MGNMFKKVFDKMLFFDSEYVPDVKTGRKIYGLPDNMPDSNVLQFIYQKGGATPQDPVPMLKSMLYRVVAISGLIRKVTYERIEGQQKRIVTLDLFSIPKSVEGDIITEKLMLERFLNSIGDNRPQICGWAIEQFDLNVLFQRAVVNKAIIPSFCKRPDKPWEGLDYFNKMSDCFVDLMDVICGFGMRTRAKLDEMALACGIPGKLGIEGSQVCDIFYEDGLEGWKRIINYCECDVMTTYLIWLNVALMGGHLSQEEYDEERLLCYNMLEERIIKHEAEHFEPFLEAWEYLPPSFQDEGDPEFELKG